MPRLPDIMVVTQIRHSKRFYAVKRGNWPLADYELDQLRSSLREAAHFYPKTVPASDLTGTDRLTSMIGDAIKSKDEAKFDLSFAEVTAECNHCHHAADRPYIFIRKPAFPSTFSNQMYGPAPSQINKQGH